jgi:hypothetical protein
VKLAIMLRSYLFEIQLNEKQLELVGSVGQLVKCKNVVWQPASRMARGYVAGAKGLNYPCMLKMIYRY